MHSIHDKDLPIITGIGENFLVTCHTGIKTDLACSCSNVTKSIAMAKSSIVEQKNCWLLIIGHSQFKNKLRKIKRVKWNYAKNLVRITHISLQQ